MAAHYSVLTEGVIVTTATLLRTYPGAVIATAVATGNPGELRRLAERLNKAEELDPSAPPTE